MTNVQLKAKAPALTFRWYAHGGWPSRVIDGGPQKGDDMLEQPMVKRPSCESDIRAADVSGLVSVLQEHLYEEHALEIPHERVREYVFAQLRDFDGYNARPISGA